ncbi:MAG: hypothetical protein HY902_13520 [Deltaproteobacteria bacterium]|nr:hypothetical protein [Deltaproteobacteria bacterium]
MAIALLAAAYFAVGCGAPTSSGAVSKDAAEPQQDSVDVAEEGSDSFANPPPDVTAKLAAGTLDLEFGSSGCTWVASANDPVTESIPYDVLVASTGDVIVAGRAQNSKFGAERGWIVRLDPVGSVKANVLVDPVEGLLGGGTLDATDHPTMPARGFGVDAWDVVRTSLDGVLDPSLVLPSSLASSYILGLQYQSTGKLVLAAGESDGMSLAAIFRLVRMQANGKVDPSFGTNGIVPLQTTKELQAAGFGVNYRAFGMVVASDDTIYIAATMATPTAAHWVMAHYTAQGQLDPNFGKGGLLDLGLVPSATSKVKNILAASRATGDMYIVGKFFSAKESYSWIHTVHVTAAGLDMSYGDGKGYARVTHQNYQDQVAAAVQADGALLVTSVGDSIWTVARITASGALDATYGDGGWFVQDVRLGIQDAPPVAMALAPDGGAVVVRHWWYVKNLMHKDQAVVCKITP